MVCLLYTSDAADDSLRVDLGGRRIIKKQMTDSSALESIIDDIISNNVDQVKQFKDGNSKLLGFFVGQVMKATQGKANPKQVNQILNEKLS